MSEKAASAGVFVEFMGKSYSEITWKREKKMVLGRIATLGTTFRKKNKSVFFFWFEFKKKPLYVLRFLVPQLARGFKTKGS